MRMKKFFTLFFLCFVSAVIALGQNLSTIVFVDKDGNQIQEGTTITANNAVIDFGIISLPSGLFVKNVSSADIGIRIHYNIQTLENGTFQICFPQTCVTKSAVGSFVTSEGVMTAGQVSNLMTEWVPSGFGQCKVTYQIELMKQTQVLPPKFESLEMGPTVSVDYIYADPSRIKDLSCDNTEATSCYGINGIQYSTLQKGLNVVRLNNGRVVKVVK